MGIFSKLFRQSSDDIEKQLENEIVPMLQSMAELPFSEAKRYFRAMLKKVKEESLKEGTSNLPQNFGDILLEKESTDENIKTMLAKRRREGVRDADIRWWWNMHDIDRRMMLEVDLTFRFALYRKLREEGSSDEVASKKVSKTFPIFGNPDDTAHPTGDDRPLPYELKNRINIYMMGKRSQIDKEKFKMELEKWSTVNAFIRNVIKRGNI